MAEIKDCAEKKKTLMLHADRTNPFNSIKKKLTADEFQEKIKSKEGVNFKTIVNSKNIHYYKKSLEKDGVLQLIPTLRLSSNSQNVSHMFDDAIEYSANLIRDFSGMDCETIYATFTALPEIHLGDKKISKTQLQTCGFSDFNGVLGLNCNMKVNDDGKCYINSKVVIGFLEPDERKSIKPENFFDDI